MVETRDVLEAAPRYNVTEANKGGGGPGGSQEDHEYLAKSAISLPHTVGAEWRNDQRGSAPRIEKSNAPQAAPAAPEAATPPGACPKSYRACMQFIRPAALPATALTFDMPLHYFCLECL